METLLFDGTILSGAGLILTFAGAAWAAYGVFLTSEEISRVTESLYGAPNTKMQAALRNQSIRAKWGLGMVAVGTLLQFIGLAQHAWEVMAR